MPARLSNRDALPAQGHEQCGAICAAAPIATKLRIFYCRKCKCRRRHRMEFFEWYAPWAKCLKCGRLIQWE